MKLLLGALCATLLAASDVLTLTDATLQDALTQHEKLLVEFYAPWCGHCKQLEPEYEKAATQLKSDGQTTVLAKIDATQEKQSAKDYKVQGFPTLKYFQNGKATEYTGGRTSDTIIDWITKRALPPLSRLNSQTEIDALSKKGKLVVVGFFEEGSSQATALEKLAAEERDTYTFGLVTSAEVAQAAQVSIPGVALYREANVDKAKRTFDTLRVVKEGGADIPAFLKAEGFPLVDEIGPENYRLYIDRGLPIAWLAVDPSDVSALESALNLAKKHAANFKGKLSIVYVDAVQYEGHVQGLGITKTPGLIIIGAGDDETKYLLEGDWNDVTVADFFESYGDGSKKPFVKSQDEPDTQDEEVYTTVGKTFASTVNESGKNVMMEFYAPWCGHCKKLAPDYEKVAEHFKDNDSVVIAKIDATENDTPEKIEGFPTLIWYPASGKKVTYPQGARTKDAIIKWIEEKISAGGEEKREL